MRPVRSRPPRSIKRPHGVPFGLVDRRDRLQVLRKFRLAAETNHQTTHLSQEADRVTVRIVVLRAQRQLDLPLVDRCNIGGMIGSRFAASCSQVLVRRTRRSRISLSIDRVSSTSPQNASRKF